MAKNKNKKKKNKNKNKNKKQKNTVTNEVVSRPSYLSNFVNGRYFPKRNTYTPPAEVKTFKRPKGQDFTIEGATGFPEVNISAVAHGKMLALVKACPIEISWMCSVTRDDKGDFNLNDVYVPLQVCGPATTEPSAEGDEAMMMELMEAGKIEELNNLKCWGHSHVNMGVFASGTDETQTDEFLERFAGEFFVRLIGNKRGELLVNVYLLDQGIILNNPDLNIEAGDVNDYMEWAKAEIEAKVTRAHVPVINTGPYTGYGGNGGTGYAPIGSPYADASRYYSGIYGQANRANLNEVTDDIGVGGSFQAPGDINAGVEEEFDDEYGIFDPQAFNVRGT